MGFTTGLLSGITLTTSTLYLTILFHRRNRLQQSQGLAHSAASLQSLVAPPTLDIPPPTERINRGGLVEIAKDRWNQELRQNVRKVQDFDWNRLGGDMEAGARSLWRTMKSKAEGASE